MTKPPKSSANSSYETTPSEKAKGMSHSAAYTISSVATMAQGAFPDLLENLIILSIPEVPKVIYSSREAAKRQTEIMPDLAKPPVI